MYVWGLFLHNVSRSSALLFKDRRMKAFSFVSTFHKQSNPFKNTSNTLTRSTVSTRRFVVKKTESKLEIDLGSKTNKRRFPYKFHSCSISIFHSYLDRCAFTVGKTRNAYNSFARSEWKNDNLFGFHCLLIKACKIFRVVTNVNWATYHRTARTSLDECE